MNSTETGLVFPCDFPLKIIGTNTPEFLTDITAIVKAHYPAIADNNIKHTLSKNNNFLAISVVVHATNKTELDALYLAITAHPDIKMVL